MIEIDEEHFRQLVKDADDNKSLVLITRSILISIIIIVILFTIVIPVFNYWLNVKNTELALNEAKAQAYINREIMAIESKGLTNEEYFKWLEVR